VKPAFADAAEFELALINVAINAKDAMTNDRGHLEITARNAIPGEAGLSGEYVVIEASDDGRGIDPNIIDRVLEPFFTTKPSGQGSGLGLAQVQAFCESSGGLVRIEPRPGGGTRVLMYLGMTREKVQSAAVADKPAADVEQQLDCEVLLVEDNASVAQSTEVLLSSFGCRVTRAGSADEALRALEQPHIDVVLSDVEMPGSMDGIGLAAALRKRLPAIPVILITGYATRLEEARYEGFNVLFKPYAPEALRAAMVNALSASKRQPVSGQRAANRMS
jgi:CheY-like chemotaxis protein